MNIAQEKGRTTIFDSRKLEYGRAYAVTIMKNNNKVFHHDYCRFRRISDDETTISFDLEIVIGIIHHTIGTIDITPDMLSSIIIYPADCAHKTEPIEIVKERIIYEWIEGALELGKAYHVRRYDEDGNETENFVGVFGEISTNNIRLATVDYHGGLAHAYIWLSCIDEYKIEPLVEGE